MQQHRAVEQKCSTLTSKNYKVNFPSKVFFWTIHLCPGPEWCNPLFKETQKYSGEAQRDWRTYEQRLAHRIKKAAEEIKPVIEQAWSMIAVSKTDRGRPSKISVTQKVLLLLLKDIFQLSNRKMANLLAFFSAFTGIDISYKSIERCYSEELVRLTVHNMFVILTKKAGIKQANACGDATGYSLTITTHYRNEREKELP